MKEKRKKKAEKWMKEDIYEKVNKLFTATYGD